MMNSTVEQVDPFFAMFHTSSSTMNSTGDV
jgi:hypothetical protein